MNRYAKRFVVLGSLFMAVGSVSAAAKSIQGVIYDLDAQYSTSLNPNGVWSYGETNGWGGTFTAFARKYSAGSVDFWIGENALLNTPVVGHNVSADEECVVSICVQPGGTIFHPGLQQGRTTTIRFTTPDTGLYSLHAEFWGADVDPQNGTNVGVLLNGVLQGSKAHVLTYDRTGTNPFVVNQAFQLNAGDSLDFTVDNNGNVSNDSIGIRAYITTSVPEPASYALFAAGLFGLLISRRKIQTPDLILQA
jgi:hypothetical protein